MAKKRKSLSMKARILLVFGALSSLVLLPTSLMLFVGLLPTLLVLLVGWRFSGIRLSTVFAMNMSGCLPFILKLWSTSHDFETSVDIITNGQTLGVIYTAAAFGIMIDFVVTGLVSSYLYQKGMSRMKAIKKRQETLITQWGRGVAGEYVKDSSDES